MTRQQRILDEKDRQIISLLAKNPEASQSFIAQQVNLSQPSVGARIQRLKQEGAIAYLVGMNFKHIGLHLAKVEV
ncbi:MAG: AsnC family transcriptional regulator, partial [Candidatus Heimdallarchaeota archaeon]